MLQSTHRRSLPSLPKSLSLSTGAVARGVGCAQHFPARQGFEAQLRCGSPLPGGIDLHIDRRRPPGLVGCFAAWHLCKIEGLVGNDAMLADEIEVLKRQLQD